MIFLKCREVKDEMITNSQTKKMKDQQGKNNVIKDNENIWRRSKLDENSIQNSEFPFLAIFDSYFQFPGVV
jgi:hypothetical protein